MADSFGGGGLGSLLAALTGGRGGTDGLGELVNRLRQGGLQEEVDSWVGPGANRDVAPDRLAGALGQDDMAGLAQRLGLGGGQGAAGGGGAIAAVLARLLPQLINGLTPQGRLPQSETEYGAGGMGGLLSQMMGGGASTQGGSTDGGGIAGMLGALTGGGGGSAGGLGALLGGLMGGAGPTADAPSGKPGPGSGGPIDKSHLGGDGDGPLPKKPG